MSPRTLVVTEDPDFIVEMRSLVDPAISVIACLGPGQGHCAMEQHGTCPLAEKADLVVVDAPCDGAFHDHYKGIPAISYAEKLAETHPQTRVVLCSPVERSGASAFSTRHEVVGLIVGRDSVMKGETDAS